MMAVKVWKSSAVARRARTVLMLLLALLAALALTACGDDSGDSEGSDDADAEDDSGDDAADDDADGDEEPMEGDLSGITDIDEMCELGVEQGGVFSAGTTSSPEQVEAIMAAFNEHYPDIDQELLAARPDEGVQRVLTEAVAGDELSLDVVEGRLDVHLPLWERELIRTDIDWEGLGVSPDVISPQNSVRNTRMGRGLNYRTDKHSPEDLPTTWEELADPDAWWAGGGQLAIDPRATAFNLLALEWGVEETVAYVERLVEAVDPVILEGTTTANEALLAGEIELSLNGLDVHTARFQAEGAPIDIVFFEVVAAVDDYHPVLKGGPNSAAAACFEVWLQTPEGQDAWYEAEFKRNDDVPRAAPDGATVVAIETVEDAETVSEATELLWPLLQP